MISIFATCLILLFRAILSQQAKVIKKNDVVLVTELTRHGARAPVSDVINYIHRDWIQNTGKGELTGVGMRQHYYLGKNTATKYAELLKGMTEYEEYYVRSTDVNRTMMSAQSHIVGLRGDAAFTKDSLIWEKDNSKVLPPVAIKDLNFDLKDIDFETPLPNGLIPFPVHVPNNNLDLLLMSDGPACPKANVTLSDDWLKANERLTKDKKV
jgi:hypothetical protein